MQHFITRFYPLRLAAFWLLFFALFRLWFVLWFQDKWAADGSRSALYAFWYALPLDVSMLGYLVLLPALFWFVGIAWGPRSFAFFEKGISGFNFLIITMLVLVCGANVFIYEEWQTPLNNRALQYLSTPRALLDSMSFGFKIASIVLCVGGIWLFWRMYKWMVGRGIYPQKISRWWVLGLLPCIAILVLAIRGGLGVMPINESAVYYSRHLFDNHAATNPAWHLIHTKLEVKGTENHYVAMPKDAAKARVNDLFAAQAQPAAQVLQWPDGTRPNVMFIVMESMTAQVIAELGGELDVCPTMSRLISQGILFTQCYSSGYRTDQGLVAVLGGYPAQPDQSIVLLSDKAAKLNALSRAYKEAYDYSTLFVYGGELTFANIGVWLRNQQFDQILSEEDFPKTEKTQRWGVDDKRVLARTLLEINRLKEPFFATALTLSLHPPFDVPYQSRWQGSTEREQFLNSAAFADHAIGSFFEAASREPWFDRTVFVLVADHGSSNPGGLDNNEPMARKVPVIIWANKMLRVEWRNRRVGTFGNHHDIPKMMVQSVLPLRTDTDLFPWSRNLLQSPDNQSDFAYYTNENGIGWATPRGINLYRFKDKTWQNLLGGTDSLVRPDARAYLQVLYDDFLEK